VTPSVKDALAALRRIKGNVLDGQHSTRDFDAIRACLEAAAAEQEAWSAIGEWQLHPRKRAQLTLGVGRLVVTLIAGDAYYNPTELEFAGTSCLSALQTAAAWIKKEGSK
jgi:hypothetical protein